MGTDVSLHVEVRIDGEWHHYSFPRVPRDYGMFAKMAGIRSRSLTHMSESKDIEGRAKWGKLSNRKPKTNKVVPIDFTPISEPKGLPKNISAPTKIDLIYYDGDDYAHSYLTMSEIRELSNWWSKPGGLGEEGKYTFESYFGELFHQPFKAFEFGDENCLYPKGIEDVRFVFWFSD